MAFVTMLHQQRSDSGFEKTAANRRWTFCPSGSRRDNQHQMHTDDPQQVMTPETCVEVPVRRRACRTRHGVPSGFDCNGDILCSSPFHTHRSPVVRRHAQQPTSLCADLHSLCLPALSTWNPLRFTVNDQRGTPPYVRVPRSPVEPVTNICRRDPDTRSTASGFRLNPTRAATPRADCHFLQPALSAP